MDDSILENNYSDAVKYIDSISRHLRVELANRVNNISSHYRTPAKSSIKAKVKALS